MRNEASYIITLVFIVLSISNVNAQFTEISLEQGIDQRHISDQLMGGGVAMFDLNKDGLVDIYTTGGVEADKLYLNEGNGRFADISDQSGVTSVTNSYETFGVIAGDINNDGCQDLFITVLASDQHNLVLLNNCDSTFTDISAQAGITQPSASTSATFLDYNKDGFLDVYVINYIDEPGALYDNDGNIIGFDHKCYPNFLYINQGNNSFQEKAESYGVNHTGCGLAVVGTDFDQDGDQDIYVANDFGEWIKPNVLYRNNYPDDSFTDVSVETGMDIGLYGMGIAIGDYDRDDDFDYYVTNLGRNYFMQNQGDGTFKDIAESLAVQNTRGNDGLFTTGWGTFFFDYDNDAYLDLFVSNGYIPAAAFIATTLNDENVLYKNTNFAFDDKGPEMGINSDRINRGVTYADFDNDGDTDLFLPSLARKESEENKINFLFFENTLENTNNWAQIYLEGTNSNKDANGSLVYLRAGEELFIQELYSGGTHASQNMHELHFGLSDFSKIDSIQIKWPSGLVEVLKDLPINQKLFVLEGEGKFQIMGCTDSSSPAYNADATYATGCYHKETFGCTDPTALNYSRDATVDDGTCQYKEVPTNIGDDLSKHVNVGPVPLRDLLRVEMTDVEGKSFNIAIFDLSGRLMITKPTSTGTVEINTSGLETGVYLVEISSEKGRLYAKKIIKV